MKRIKLIFTGAIASVLLLSSCSSDEENGLKENAGAMKTASMLSFESALKKWYASNPGANNDVLPKNDVRVNSEIRNQAVTLLKELGVSASEIDSRKGISDDMFIYFTLEEYSKTLAEQYNQNKN
ncbi:hypothetical protein [Flavobacterium sp.]|uniref:hypothetical protein n=1 Tax=Flavobacterium sp. TaxID=239 RepID=UPI00261B6CEC|nr:hypothetical protein [Flavobacterium sp.]